MDAERHLALLLIHMGLVQSGGGTWVWFKVGKRPMENFMVKNLSHIQMLVAQWGKTWFNGEFQDPKIEVLYHTSGHIVCLIYGRCLQFRSVLDA